MPDMDAARAGLQKGDILVSVNGTADPLHIQASRHHQPGWRQAGQHYLRTHRTAAQVTVTPARKTMDGTEQWMIGVSLEPKLVITKLALPGSFRRIRPAECEER